MQRALKFLDNNIRLARPIRIEQEHQAKKHDGAVLWNVAHNNGFLHIESWRLLSRSVECDVLVYWWWHTKCVLCREISKKRDRGKKGKVLYLKFSTSSSAVDCLSCCLIGLLTRWLNFGNKRRQKSRSQICGNCKRKITEKRGCKDLRELIMPLCSISTCSACSICTHDMYLYF